MLRQTSLGTLGLFVGGALTVVGFGAYFANNATLNLVGFFYGIPLLLGGFALKAAELKPVPLSAPTADAIATLRDQQATDIQNQVRRDVTRYRYGQSAHLDSTLTHLGLSPNDDQRPVLTGLRETETMGAYTLVLEFASPHVPFATWQQKENAMTRFFGPGVQVQVSQPAGDRVDLAIVAAPTEPSDNDA